MSSFCRRIIPSLSLLRVQKIEKPSRTHCSIIFQLNSAGSNKPALSSNFIHNQVFIRHKSKKDDSDDEEDYNDDSSLTKDSKIVKFSTTSMRTDGILKSALGVARNKIEQAFYESRIRVNGKKIMKKSASVREGDEIDIIKAVSAKNADHLHVSRVEILKVGAQEDSITVTARRFKSLLIENYEQDPHKSSGNSDN